MNVDQTLDLSIARRIVYHAGDQANNDKIDRKYTDALQYYTDLYKKRPEAQAFQLGAILWLTGSYVPACDRWLIEIGRLNKKEASSTDGAGGVIAPSMLWWASGHASFEKYLKPSLVEIKKRLKTKYCQQSTWPGSIARFIIEELDEEELVRIASTSHSHPTIIGRQATQAWFYASGAYLHTGDMEGYYECLKKAYSIVVSLLEDEWFLARYELERVDPSNLDLQLG